MDNNRIESNPAPWEKLDLWPANKVFPDKVFRERVQKVLPEAFSADNVFFDPNYKSTQAPITIKRARDIRSIEGFRFIKCTLRFIL